VKRCRPSWPIAGEARFRRDGPRRDDSASTDANVGYPQILLRDIETGKHISNATISAAD